MDDSPLQPASPPRAWLGAIYRFWLCLRDVFPLLRLCRFSFIMVLIGAVVLIWVDQAQEALRALAEHDDFWSGTVGWAVFFLCVFAWAFYSAYCARVILYIDFPDALKQGRCTAKLRQELPRWLGVAAIVAAAIALAASTMNTPENYASWRLWVLAATCAALAYPFYLFMKSRLALIDSLKSASLKYVARLRKAEYLPPEPVAPALDRHAAVAKNFADLQPDTRWAFAVFFSISVLCFVLFTFAPLRSGQMLGAVTILLLALAAWIPFGTILVYWTERYRLPPLMGVLLLWAIAISYYADNHEIRTLPPADAAIAAPDLTKKTKDWLDSRREQINAAQRGYPVFFVAAEGGGIRAAYWTAAVLAALEDQLHGAADNARFSDHVFAVSGVSGGSLGAAVFAALLAERNRGITAGCTRSEIKNSGTNLQNCAHNALHGDFLAPTIATLLYPDLVYRFLPVVPAQFSDRATTLETAWEAGWRKALPQSDSMAEAFDALWKGDKDMKVPSLFLNATSVETGKRMIMSNVQIKADDFSDAYDIQREAGHPVRLSTAAHMSARFTYVSPAGTLVKQGKAWAHIVDGGYFENSGATTAAEAIHKFMRIADEAGLRGKIIPVAILITNNPGRELQACATGKPQFHAHRWITEVLSPLNALLQTREARGTYAEESLRTVAAEAGGECVRLALLQRDVPLPLGWVLSDNAETEIDKQLDLILKSTAADGPYANLRGLMQ
jgi:predicted acylesterase/phospholipase RssA